MPDLPDDIARINALTTNARNTWFALLGVLVFVGITLMGVEHIDFYGVGRTTKLPLVDVEVPTRYFFIAAPILTAAIYGYFHLYLIRLWDALSVAKARYEGRPLGDVITPWLVTDAALHRRAHFRAEICSTTRPMETPATLLNLFLAWGFGLIVLGFVWWQSMPARSFMMTGIAAFSLVFCLTCGYVSWRSMVFRMKSSTVSKTSVTDEPLATIIPTVSFYLLIFISLFRTELPQSGIPLAQLILVDKEITERPDDWLSCKDAKRNFLAQYTDRERRIWGEKAELNPEAFEQEWLRQRTSHILSVDRPDLSREDFRFADLRGSVGVGLKLPKLPWEGANLSLDIFEGTPYYDIKKCSLDWANINLKGMGLVGALLNGLDFGRARFENFDFSNASMDGITARGAKFINTLLYRASLRGANLSQTLLENTPFVDVDLTNAILDFSYIVGSPNQDIIFLGARLAGTKNRGGALRHVDLNDLGEYGDTFTYEGGKKTTDFRNVFLDGTVKYDGDFAYMADYPCQWVKEPIDNERTFASIWRWWIEEGEKTAEFGEYIPAWGELFQGTWNNIPAASEALRVRYGIPENCTWNRETDRSGQVPSFSGGR